MTQKFLSSTRPSTVMRFAETPVPNVSKAEGHFDVLGRPFVGSEPKEFSSEVQVLNLHPGREKTKSGITRLPTEGERGSVTPQSMDELYWLLPGAVLSDSESCFSS